MDGHFIDLVWREERLHALDTWVLANVLNPGIDSLTDRGQRLLQTHKLARLAEFVRISIILYLNRESWCFAVVE